MTAKSNQGDSTVHQEDFRERDHAGEPPAADSSMRPGRSASPGGAAPSAGKRETGRPAARYGSSEETPATGELLAGLKELVQVVVPAIALALLIHLYVAQATIVRGQSMLPNLRPAERLIMEKLTYYFQGPRHNEIVVLDLPDSPNLMIKRVVGLPGDTVAIRGGRVFLNGSEAAPLAQDGARWPTAGDGEEATAPSRFSDSHASFGPLTLTEDSYFVLGDNRENSNDSRAFGPVPSAVIKGRVWLRYWPLSRLTVFGSAH